MEKNDVFKTGLENAYKSEIELCNFVGGLYSLYKRDLDTKTTRVGRLKNHHFGGAPLGLGWEGHLGVVLRAWPDFPVEISFGTTVYPDLLFILCKNHIDTLLGTSNPGSLSAPLGPLTAQSALRSEPLVPTR